MGGHQGHFLLLVLIPSSKTDQQHAMQRSSTSDQSDCTEGRLFLAMPGDVAGEMVAAAFTNCAIPMGGEVAFNPL